MSEKTLTELEKLEKIINKFIEVNERSPFIDIQFKEPENPEESESNTELDISMEKEFEEVIEKELKDSSETLGLYFTKVLTEMVESLKDSENS
jgi:hypothetical protein